MPWITDASGRTPNTPMPTPMMVSAARPLLAMIASNAIVMPWSAVTSLRKKFIFLFLAQGFDGVEQRSAAGRVHAGHDADDGAEQRRYHDGPWRYRGWQRREIP